MTKSSLIRNIFLLFLLMLGSSVTMAVEDAEFTDANIIRTGKFEGINTYGKPWVQGSGTCESIVTRKCASFGQNTLSSSSTDQWYSSSFYSSSSRYRHQRSMSHDSKHKISWTAYKCNHEDINENDPRIGTGTGSHFDPTEYNKRISRYQRDGYKRLFEYFVCSEEPLKNNPLDRLYSSSITFNSLPSNTLIDDTGNVIVMDDNIGELYNRDGTYSRQTNQRKHRQQFFQQEQKRKKEIEIYEENRKRSICGETTERSPIVCLQTIPEIPSNPDGASYGGRPEINEISNQSPNLIHRSSSRKRGSYCTCYHRQDTVGLSSDSYSQQNQPTISHDFPLDHRYPTTPNIFSGSADDYFDRPT